MEKILINKELNLELSIMGEGYTFKLQPFKDGHVVETFDCEPFQVAFSSNSMRRIAFSLYLDGVGVMQHYGVTRQSDVTNVKLLECHADNVLFGEKETMDEVIEMCTFILNDGSNPKLLFTHQKNESIGEHYNEKIGNITIFFWLEGERKQLFDSQLRSMSDSFVGIGEDTNKTYESGSPIYKPQYIGCATIYHKQFDRQNTQNRVIYAQKPIV